MLFLVAAGLQLVFGVQRILNLACGAFYAIGAYCGVTAGGYALGLGLPPLLALPVLMLAGGGGRGARARRWSGCCAWSTTGTRASSSC